MLDDDPFISKQHAMDAGRQSEELRSAFGQALHRGRLEAGLSPARIEQITGVPEAELLEIESGRTDPALATMAALAKALGRNLSKLLPGAAH